MVSTSEGAKKRGRPAKAKPEAKPEESSGEEAREEDGAGDVTGDVTATTATSGDDEQSPTEDAAQKADGAPAAKRGRGRPKKDPSKLKTKPKPVGGPKRGRGRPKKTA